MEDIVARYRLELSDLRAQVQELKSQFKIVDDASKNSAKNSSSSFKNLGFDLERVGQQLIGALAIGKIIQFGTECVEQFGKAELAAKRLSSAVSVNGGTGKDFKDFIQLADNLGRISIFSNTQIKEVETMALSVGLSVDNVKKLIPVLSDIASAKGLDLGTVFEGVRSGLDGSEKALKAYGIRLDATQSKADRFNSILQQANKLYAGQTELAGTSTEGAIKKLDNAYGNLKESIGKFIAQKTPLTSMLTIASNLFENGLDLSPTGIAKAFGQSGAQLDSLNKKTTESTKKENAEKLKSNIDYTKLSIDELNKLKDANDAFAEDELKRREERAKVIAAINIRIQESENATIKNEFAKKRADLQVALEKELADYREQLRTKLITQEDFNRVSRALQRQLQQDTGDVNFQQRLQLLDTQQQEEINQLKSSYTAKADFSDDAEINLQKGILDIQKLYDELRIAEILGATKDAERIKATLVGFEKQNQDAILAIDRASAEKNAAEIQKAIDLESEKKIEALKESYLKAGDFTESAEKELNEKIFKIQQDADILRAEEKYKSTHDLIQLEKDITAVTQAETDHRIAIAKKEQEDLRKAIEDSVTEIFTTYTSINEQVIQSQKDTAQNQKDEQDAKSTEEEDKLKEQFDQRIIGQDEYEKKIQAIKDRREGNEKALQERMRKLQAKEALFQKAQTIFNIGLHTHEALMSIQAKWAAFPPIATALTIETLVVAAAQLAAALAIDPPQSHSGEKFVSHNKKSNRRGPLGPNETLRTLEIGERVFDRHKNKNKENWEIFEAIDNGNRDAFIYHRYIAPALAAQKRSYEASKERSFAENVANNFMISSGRENGLSEGTFLKIFKKGIPLSPATIKQLASLMQDSSFNNPYRRT